MSAPLRVHIAARDSALAGVLAGLVTVTPGVHLSAQVRCADVLESVLEQMPADLVLVGCEALGTTAAQATDVLARLLRHTEVLLVERRSADRCALAEMMEIGAAGVVSASELSTGMLRQVLALVRDGGRYVSADLAADVLRVTTTTPLPQLTPRERQVAGLLAEGATASVVARQLGIAHKTVKNHITNVYAKLHVSSRAELQEIVHAELAAA